jgi:phosphatidylglycerol:prolipoprotein diacylglycerol transferase
MIQHPIVHQPFSYELGFLQITGFGLAVLLAFVVAQIVAQAETARRGYDPEPFADLVFVAVIGGLAGAKIYYAILTGDITSLWSRAGFVFWGGLIGGIVAVAFVVRRKKLGVMRIADVAGIGVAAAYAVGRSGCWAVGDDYGRPWNGFLATVFPEGAPPSTAENMRALFGVPIPPTTLPGEVIAVHPTQLYETAMGMIMFAVLWRLRDHRHATGWLAGVYCVLAGVERFIVEFFRAKDDRFFGPFTTAQVIAILFVAAGIALMSARWRIGPGRPGILAHPSGAPSAA